MTDLVEEVARALWEAQCDHWMHYRGQISELCEYDQLGHSKQGELAREARAAIAVVIERCAKVAESAQSYDDLLQKSAGGLTSGQRIAAAIRKLGESE